MDLAQLPSAKAWILCKYLPICKSSATFIPLFLNFTVELFCEDSALNNNTVSIWGLFYQLFFFGKILA